MTQSPDIKKEEILRMYHLEEDLVNEFIEYLPFSTFAMNGQLNYSTEFNYLRGRTDIIILSQENEIIAIEAKLKKWRDALHQAYRNTCFAHYSYILVPENVAKVAEKYLPEFSKRSVGLCFISNNEIFVSLEAKPNQPLQQWLYEKAIQSILE